MSTSSVLAVRVAGEKRLYIPFFCFFGPGWLWISILILNTMSKWDWQSWKHRWPSYQILLSESESKLRRHSSRRTFSALSTTGGGEGVVCYFLSPLCDCGCDESNLFSAPSTCSFPPRLGFDGLFFSEKYFSPTVHCHPSYFSFKQQQ